MKKLLALALSSVLLLSACTPQEVKVAKRISKSTVLVHILMSNGDKHGGALCSGVVISPKEILLANHCVNPSEGVKLDQIWIEDIDGNKQPASVASKDPLDDLALLNIKNPETPAKLSSNDPQTGQAVWVVGMPLSLHWVVSKGIVSGTDLNVDGFLGSFFVTDAVVLPGNSGGGAWNDKGELIGIVSMSTSMFGGFGASGLGIIVDTQTIRKFLFLQNAK